MSSRLRLTARARSDLSGIWTQVAKNGPHNAERVLDGIGQHIELLETYPLLGRLRPDIGKDVRTLASGRWLILYRIEGDGVVVSRIADGSRDLARLSRPRR